MVGTSTIAIKQWILGNANFRKKNKTADSSMSTEFSLKLLRKNTLLRLNARDELRVQLCADGTIFELKLHYKLSESLWEETRTRMERNTRETAPSGWRSSILHYEEEGKRSVRKFKRAEIINRLRSLLFNHFADNEYRYKRIVRWLTDVEFEKKTDQLTSKRLELILVIARLKK